MLYLVTSDQDETLYVIASVVAKVATQEKSTKISTQRTQDGAINPRRVKKLISYSQNA